MCSSFIVCLQLGPMHTISKTAQHSVHPTGGTLRVFKHFAWLEAGSAKLAFSRPTHQPVTQAVGRHKSKSYFEGTPLKNRTQCTHTNICAFFNPFWVHRVLSRVAAFCCHGSLRNCGASFVEFFLAHSFCAANTL